MNRTGVWIIFTMIAMGLLMLSAPGITVFADARQPLSSAGGAQILYQEDEGTPPGPETYGWTEEEIRMGQPASIIFGAGILAVLVFAGVGYSVVSRQGHPKTAPRKK